ncbi:MAG TPA: group III truncated hemoglobin [Steroidobacteraceae bacterium]|nr:group III truncated hemoglobin [Steroidobacteraceae bacterium]
MSEELSSRHERRAAFAAQVHSDTDIDDAMIEKLVHGFYARIRSDEVLGPIFAQRITHWEPHLRRMCEFWSSVVLMSGRYHGQPMIKHLPLPVDATHFDRWLMIFETSARELCPPSAADHFIKLAQRIATSLELGIASNRGLLLGNGERLPPN